LINKHHFHFLIEKENIVITTSLIISIFSPFLFIYITSDSIFLFIRVIFNTFFFLFIPGYALLNCFKIKKELNIVFIAPGLSIFLFYMVYLTNLVILPYESSVFIDNTLILIILSIISSILLIIALIRKYHNKIASIKNNLLKDAIFKTKEKKILVFFFLICTVGLFLSVFIPALNYLPLTLEQIKELYNLFYFFERVYPTFWIFLFISLFILIKLIIQVKTKKDSFLVLLLLCILIYVLFILPTIQVKGIVNSDTYNSGLIPLQSYFNYGFTKSTPFIITIFGYGPKFDFTVGINIFFSSILGIDSISYFRFFIPLLNLIIVLGFFYFSSYFIKSDKVRLLTTFFFLISPFLLDFGDNANPQILGLYSLVLSLTFLLKFRDESNLLFFLLSVFLSILTIFSHHLESFILFIFLIIYPLIWVKTRDSKNIHYFLTVLLSDLLLLSVICWWILSGFIANILGISIDLSYLLIWLLPFVNLIYFINFKMDYPIKPIKNDLYKVIKIVYDNNKVCTFLKILLIIGSLGIILFLFWDITTNFTSSFLKEFTNLTFWQICLFYSFYLITLTFLPFQIIYPSIEKKDRNLLLIPISITFILFFFFIFIIPYWGLIGARCLLWWACFGSIFLVVYFNQKITNNHLLIVFFLILSFLGIIGAMRSLYYG